MTMDSYKLYKIELPAMRYVARMFDMVAKYGADGVSDHHFLAQIDDIKRDHGEDAPYILARMGELFSEQAEALDSIDAYKRLKQAAGAPKRGGMQWLQERGLAKWDETRGAWLFRKLPLTDEQWVVAKEPVRVRRIKEVKP
jgi:hypothetical protein